MKNKFLVLTLCFTIFISSLNINKSHADGGIISLPMLATVCSLGVATGVVLKDSDDLYDMGRLFYEYVKNRNETTWEAVKLSFAACVSLAPNNMINVKGEFLETVKGFLNDTFIDGVGDIGISYGIPSYSVPFAWETASQYNGLSFNDSILGDGTISFTVGDLTFKPTSKYFYAVYLGNTLVSLPGHTLNFSTYVNGSNYKVFYDSQNIRFLRSDLKICLSVMSALSSISIPYQGGFEWGKNIEDKKEQDDSLSLPIPNNLGNLVGQGSKEFWDNSKDLVGNGSVSIPHSNNPSIGLDGTTTFPLDGTVDTPTDTPTDTPNSGVLDWVVSLVIPSSTYWADTFDTFFTNVGNAFPMININRFKDLCINGVPPKDIDVTIMGAKGKIFNTEHLNSVIGWLQPIVSAFMAFLLMLYNYRKVYKLIRGFEPFSGIADGNSVGEVRGKMDGAMPEMGSSSFVGPSTAGTWSNGQSVTRGSIQSKYYGRDL